NFRCLGYGIVLSPCRRIRIACCGGSDETREPPCGGIRPEGGIEKVERSLLFVNKGSPYVGVRCWRVSAPISQFARRQGRIGWKSHTIPLIKGKCLGKAPSRLQEQVEVRFERNKEETVGPGLN